MRTGIGYDIHRLIPTLEKTRARVMGGKVDGAGWVVDSVLDRMFHSP